jgi:hypothetical protein
MITKWAATSLFKIWRLQKWALPFNFFKTLVLASTLHHDSFAPGAKHCNGEDNHYKVQRNKFSNDLLHIPLHCILIIITLAQPNTT